MTAQSSPAFEQIHDPSHYQNVFYNADLNAYVSFSFERIQNHFLQKPAVSPLAEFMNANQSPSFYHMHEDRLVRINLSDIGEIYSQTTKVFEGATFKNTVDGTSLLLDKKEMDRQQQCGLMFDENRNIMFHFDYQKRWDHLVSVLHEKTEPQTHEDSRKTLWALPSSP